MPRARRICRDCTHPAEIGKARCGPCERAADRARGSREDRGYDAEHRRQRARWAPLVARGLVDCWRCKIRIEPGEAWQLGHQDDRDLPAAPEHKTLCNLRAAGLKSQGLPWTPAP